MIAIPDKGDSMDDRTIQPEETPQKTKAELFAENPDRFVDLTEIVFAIFRDPETNKISRTLTQMESIEESFVVEGRTRESCETFRMMVRTKAAQTKSIQVVKGNGKGIMNGARNLFKR